MMTHSALRQAGCCSVLMGLTLLAFLGGSPVARADECEDAAGAAADVERFFAKATAAHQAGSGTMDIRDVLVGVTDIDAEDQAGLDQRQPVTLKAEDATHGAYESRGAKRLSVSGAFAGKDTLFRLPKLAKGRYELTETEAVLTYDPEFPVEVGISVLGIHLYKEVHRQVMTRDSLAFYFAGNDGDEPDRCYRILK